MNLLEGYDGIIFDMDGVLWNSNTCHERAYSETLKPLGVNIPPYNTIAGKRTDDVMKNILETSGVDFLEKDIVNLVCRKRKLANKYLAIDKPISNGVFSLLKNISNSKKIALASSSSKKNVNLFLNTSKTKQFFSTVLTGDDVALAKPDPEIYIKAAELLNIKPNKILVIEDALSGVEAAINAGLSVIAITGTYSRSELENAKSLYVIDNLSQLLK
jgi:beta-phosphoglucomutase